MATVTGITVKRADEIAGASVVSGRIVPQTGQLELTKGDGTTQNAGLVVAAPITRSAWRADAREIGSHEDSYSDCQRDARPQSQC